MGLYRKLRAAFDRQPWLMRRAIWDGMQLVVVAPFIFLLSLHYQVYEQLYFLSRRYENLAIEEILTVVYVISILTILYVIRRISDVRREIASRQISEARARALARRDPLTGLSNRRALNETLAEEIMVADAGQGGFSLFLLDLDRFKPVNDLFGHVAGDEALRQVSRRIADAAGPATCVARVGGDEFAIVVPCSGNESDNVVHADRILQEFEQPFDIAGKPMRIGASLGIACYPNSGDDAEALFRHADVALYKAKQQGRNRFCLYADEMETGARELARMTADLKRGLRENEFVPFFQPLVDLRSGRIVGMEVLARWQHPVHGLVNPDRFIPVAEAINLIGDLTFQVLRKACRSAKQWERDLFLAINISQTQLRDQWLPERIIAVLAETGFPARKIEVEITENSLVEDIDVARSILYSLKNQGMRIALDDFGTGYSSLVHLRDLPLDKIKIDRSFVMSLKTDIGSAKIVSAILGLGTSLGLPTVAEGIESDEAASILAELGCAYGQGYLYSKPIPADEVMSRFIDVADTERTPRRMQVA